jgi:hypothetical protein
MRTGGIDKIDYRARNRYREQYLGNPFIRYDFDL